MKKLFTLFGFLYIATLTSFAQTNIPTSATGPAAATPKPSNSFYYPEYSPFYQRVLVPNMPTQDTTKITINAIVDSVFIATNYFDPLNRPYETILKQASPSKKDFVAFSAYDEFNRQTTAYLPFSEQLNNTNDGLFKVSPVTDDSAFYKGQFSNENIYYSQTTYDATPLERITKTTAPGNSWTGAGVGVSNAWRANTAADSVRQWTIPISSEDDVPTTTTIYANGALFVYQVTDERGILTLEYKDEIGRKILTKTQVSSSPSTGHAGWLCTYYVYDEANNLRMIIPPTAVDALNNSTVNWNFSNNTSINTNLCYENWYDYRERVIMKRIPDKGKTYIAYDLFDRVVMIQDANLRTANKWRFILYDGQNRPDTAGIITTTLVKDSVIAQASRSTKYPTLTGTFTINTALYYDDYSWISVTGAPLTSSLVTTNINSTNFNTNYNSSPTYPQQVVQSTRTRGMITGAKKIIVDSTGYLWHLNIYDDHGRIIQNKQTNYSSGTDVATIQYNFIGRVLNTLIAHQKSGNNAQTHTLSTKYTYDHIGRLLTVTKNLDNIVSKTVSTNTYNELSELSTKVFGSSIETQNYVYNIRGWLLSINSSYVTTAGSTSSHFGETLSYDYGFINNQLNGNIAGVKWKAAGDGIARAYGYTFDDNNRLTVADFSQQNQGSTSWTKDKVDYTVNGLSYDDNGNTLSMKQVGLVDGKPTTVDSLTYQYFASSNQLQKVSDGSSVTAPLGDFKDTSYTGNDYAYDSNGNTLKDYNKHIVTTSNANGVTYNYLDKADSIVITNKGAIHYYYDASGLELRKQINDYTTRVLIKKNYLYIDGFVYLNDTLQYVLQEEGQIRYAKKTNSSTGATYYTYEYDYFIKDHQGNVRTILTEGRDTATYSATMESKDSIVVANTWSNVYSPVNTVTAKPTGFDTDTSNHNVSVLNASAGVAQTGPSIVLKVMAGDQVQINAYSFYNTATQSPQSGVNLLSSILNVLGNQVIGNSGGKLVAGDLTNVNNALSPNVTQFLNNSRPYDSTRPKAYLNWILFDDQFNYVASNSGAAQVVADTTKYPLVATPQTISKNGYLYVYVSNESPQNVYFDNITVKQYTGGLQQEQSYYPHGLPMAGISDKELLKTITPYKANEGTELEEDYAIEYYNTQFRKYDPQIGRFTGVDMLAELTREVTPYHFGANNPTIYTDPSGAEDAIPVNSKGQWVDGVDAFTFMDGLGGDGPISAGGGDGSANSGDGAAAVDGGYSFDGASAQKVFEGLQNAYDNPDVDGYASFTVGTQNGNIGYWQQYGFTYNDDRTILEGAGVGREFVPLTTAAIIGIHSNVGPDADFTDGHAWISLSDPQGHLLATYSLWPDDHPLFEGQDPNHTKTDVRKNTELNNGYATSDQNYNFYKRIDQNGLNNLMKFINTYCEWSYFYTCASWSRDAFFEGTGIYLDAVEWGTGTPRELARAIIQRGVNTPQNPE